MKLRTAVVTGSKSTRGSCQPVRHFPKLKSSCGNHTLERFCPVHTYHAGKEENNVGGGGERDRSWLYIRKRRQCRERCRYCANEIAAAQKTQGAASNVTHREVSVAHNASTGNSASMWHPAEKLRRQSHNNYKTTTTALTTTTTLATTTTAPPPTTEQQQQRHSNRLGNRNSNDAHHMVGVAAGTADPSPRVQARVVGRVGVRYPTSVRRPRRPARAVEEVY